MEQRPGPVGQPLIELEVQSLIKARRVAAARNDNCPVIDERLLSTHELVRAVGEGQGRARFVDEVGRRKGQVLDRHGTGGLLVPERTRAVHVDADNAEIEDDATVRVQKVLAQDEGPGPVHEADRARARQGRSGLQVECVVNLYQTARIESNRPGRRVGQGVQLGHSQQFTRFDHQRPVVDEVAVDDRMLVHLEGRAQLIVDVPGEGNNVVGAQLRDLEQGPVPVGQPLIETEIDALVERPGTTAAEQNRAVVDEGLLRPNLLVCTVDEGQRRAGLVDEIGRHKGQVLDRHGTGGLLVAKRPGAVHVDADNAEIKGDAAVRVQEILTQVEEPRSGRQSGPSPCPPGSTRSAGPACRRSRSHRRH